MPITRLSLTLLGVTLGLVALPPVAGADVYCVNYPCIGGHSAATVDEALAAAAAHDGDDTVRIGAGTYGGTLASVDNDHVTVIGSGTGATTLTDSNPGDVLSLVNGSVRSLRIRATGSAGRALDLKHGTASNVVLESLTTRQAALLGNGAVLEDSSADAADNDAVRADCPAGCTVRDSRLEAAVSAIHAAAGSELTVDGVVAETDEGGVGIEEGAQLTLTRSSFRAAAAGLFVKDATATVRHVTFAGSGGGSMGVVVLSDDTHASVALDATVIDGHAIPLRRVAGALGADVTARASAWDRSKEDLGQGGGSVDVAGIVDLAGRAAGFADRGFGDFTPAPGSPLLDAVPGDVPGGFADLRGSGATDGDGDGVVRRDIGALEGATGAPRRPAADQGGQPGPAGGPAAGAGGVGPAGGAGAADTAPPVLGRVRLTRRRLAVPRRGKAATTLVFELSEPATVEVAVQRRRGRRWVAVTRKAPFAARAGLNRRRVSVSASRLRPGAHRIVVRATDAAGNRGLPKRPRLVVR